MSTYLCPINLSDKEAQVSISCLYYAKPQPVCQERETWPYERNTLQPLAEIIIKNNNIYMYIWRLYSQEKNNHTLVAICDPVCAS